MGSPVEAALSVVREPSSWALHLHAFKASPMTDTAKKPPAEIRHEWKRTDKKRGIYTCQHCGTWTANVPLYFNEVCEARDRRKGAGRRAGDRR